jgi:hypothetical protein
MRKICNSTVAGALGFAYPKTARDSFRNSKEPDEFRRALLFDALPSTTLRYAADDKSEHQNGSAV